MSTTQERLAKIIATFVPSQIKYRPQTINKKTFLQAYKVKEAHMLPLEEDSALQQALKDYLREEWDTKKGALYTSASPVVLFEKIKTTIQVQYLAISQRCNATKRKTADFIYKITLNDKHLANYLIAVFIDISSSDFESKSRYEKEAMFEKFEALRRTYGKRG